MSKSTALLFLKVNLIRCSSCIYWVLGKSILPHDFSITLKKDEPQSFEVTSCNAELFKSWLATVKSLQYKVDNDEVVQNFIVETRKGKF